MSADRPIGGILGHLGPHLTLVTCNLSPTAGIRSSLQTSPEKRVRAYGADIRRFFSHWLDRWHCTANRCHRPAPNPCEKGAVQEGVSVLF